MAELTVEAIMSPTSHRATSAYHDDVNQATEHSTQSVNGGAYDQIPRTAPPSPPPPPPPTPATLSCAKAHHHHHHYHHHHCNCHHHHPPNKPTGPKTVPHPTHPVQAHDLIHSAFIPTKRELTAASLYHDFEHAEIEVHNAMLEYGKSREHALNCARQWSEVKVMETNAALETAAEPQETMQGIESPQERGARENCLRSLRTLERRLEDARASMRRRDIVKLAWWAAERMKMDVRIAAGLRPPEPAVANEDDEDGAEESLDSDEGCQVESDVDEE